MTNQNNPFITRQEPELSGARFPDRTGQEPQLGGGRAFDWTLWDYLLNADDPAAKRAQRIPDEARQMYVSALVRALPPNAIYARPTRTGQIWRGKYSDPQRLSAIYLLGAIRDGGTVAALAAQLQTPSNHLRIAVIIALGWIGTPEAVVALASILDHPHEPSRIEAARWLGWMNNRAAVRPLIRALSDSSQPMRLAAASSLASLNDPRAFGALARAFWHSAGTEQRMMLGALADFDRRRAVGMLTQALDPDRPQRYAIARAALERLNTPDARDALEDYEHRLSGDFGE